MPVLVQENGLEFVGLSLEEVARRRQAYGPNRLPLTRHAPWWRMLAAQMGQFFALMLWVAGLLSIFAGTLEQGLAIFGIILLNGAFAFLQEYRAELAGERLQALLPLQATVMRAGRRQTIAAEELVPGDLVLLAAGDRIAADLRWLQAQDLTLNLAALTGESVPVPAVEQQAGFAGTFVIEGEGSGEVTAIGGATELARLARLAAGEKRPPSSLARELRRLVKIIAYWSLALGLGFWALALLVGIPSRDGFLFAVGVTVAMVPEGLLPTVTLSLAYGARQMARRQALVRRLEAVETLGSTTFICTDKTGTLTCNEMAVTAVWTPVGEARIRGIGYEPRGSVIAEPSLLPRLRELASAAARFGHGRIVEQSMEGRWVAEGNPLEAALAVLAARLGVDVAAEEQTAPALREYPFDARRRRASVAAGGKLLVRGAPEAVLAQCAAPAPGAERVPAEAAVARLASSGARVLAIAARALTPEEAAGGLSADAARAECGLQLLGLVAITDPPRPEAKPAIAACRRAGVRVAMVTGDHAATARAIAREVGLWRGERLAFEGRALPKDEAVLGALLDRDGVVVSRVSPEDKLRITRALQARGHVVAMTGDGVNDAPVLQQADIGVAMGRSGTDVARAAADLVLLDDNFATIVAAVELGRATFTNARHFLTYHLTSNISELVPFVVWALSGGRFPLAIGVLQILLIDVLTDAMPALALGLEAPQPGAMQAPPSRRHLVDGPLLARSLLILGPAEAAMEMAAFLAAMLALGWRAGLPFPHGAAQLAASGAAFTAVIVGQMGAALACRSGTRWPGALGWTTNPYLLGALAFEAAVLLALLYVPPFARLLQQAPGHAAGNAVALAALPAMLLVDALYKRWRATRPSDQ